MQKRQLGNTKIYLTSLGFGYAYYLESKMAPVSFGFSINQLLSTTITDQVAIDTVYNSIDPNVYHNLSNFEDLFSFRTLLTNFLLQGTPNSSLTF